jgi:hypothetical protein
VATGLVEVLGVEVGSSKSIDVGVGLVEAASQVVESRKSAGVGVGLVVVSGVDLVFVVEVAGELLFTTYVTPSIRSLAALSTSVNAGAQLKPSNEGRVT